MTVITSASNQQVRNVCQLLAKAKERRSQGLFVVEGKKCHMEAPPAWIEHVYVSESLAAEDALLWGRASSFPFTVVKDGVFARMSDTQTPQGILTVCRMPSYGEEQLRRENGLYVVLENLQDPGNLGTILRTGEGAGLSGVLLTKGCVDLFSPKVIRSTMGSIFRVPFLQVEGIGQALLLLKKWGIRSYAGHLKGTAFYDEKDYVGGSAFLIGNEGNGLSQEGASLADEWIKIPMEGEVESLNAAMASGILLYEAARQRRRAQKSPG